MLPSLNLFLRVLAKDTGRPHEQHEDQDGKGSRIAERRRDEARDERLDDAEELVANAFMADKVGAK